MAYKVEYIQNFSQIDKDEKPGKLKELVENFIKLLKPCGIKFLITILNIN